MMVTVASYSFPYEAHIARAQLESEGIPAFVADEHTINMQWLYSDALGGVKVQVPEALAGRARILLSQDNSDCVVALQGEEKLRCPACGSEQVEFWVKGRRPAFLVFIALQFPFWPFSKEIKCKDCGVLSHYSKDNAL